jgi:RHS repeat-associated protein
MVEINNSGTITQRMYSPTGFLMEIPTTQKKFVPLPGGATVVYLPGVTGGYYYRHPDWLGSPRFASTPSRTMYYDVAYGPFGAPYAQAGTPEYTFTGQEHTFPNLYDFPAREYAIQGRWPSPDPAGLAAVDPTNPQSWNRYAYVMNNPLALIDPLGLGHCSVGSDLDIEECEDAGGIYWPNGSGPGTNSGAPGGSSGSDSGSGIGSGFFGPGGPGDPAPPGPPQDGGNPFNDSFFSGPSGNPSAGGGLQCVSDSTGTVHCTVIGPTSGKTGGAGTIDWQWLSTFGKAFFTGFSLFGDKNDPRPSCAIQFAKDTVGNFFGYSAFDAGAVAGAAAYQYTPLQAVPRNLGGRGNLSTKAWLRANQVARVKNAALVGLLVNVIVAEGQSLATEVSSASDAACK